MGAGVWTQKANFGGGGRAGAVGFSIGTKGYIGTGWNGSNFFSDFWEYDPSTNTWTQKADFGGAGRWDAVGFSIGNKGYVGTGGGSCKDFWEYDPSTNTWTRKADFGGAGRSGAVGFSIGTKGYVGTGYGGNYEYFKDFWEYDPSTDTWTQKADFGGGERECAVGFSIGTKGYIGTGYCSDVYFKDFWEYDPSTNTWTRKSDFGGSAREFAVGFSIGTKGYIGTGLAGGGVKDFWEYDPSKNNWTQKAALPGAARWRAVGFSIGNKGYVGTGSSASYGSIIYLNDFWEFSLPVMIQTTNATNVTDTAGTLNGNLLDLGNHSSVSCYFKYRKSSDLEWTSTSIQSKTSPGTFSCNLTGLQKGATYYFKAVVEYEGGVEEGNMLSFTTISVTTGIWISGGTGTWAQVANFGGVGRRFAVGFSIGTKGYVGTGEGISGYFKDFWEYDSSTNTWTQKADFGGAGRSGAVGFSIGTKGYVGTGSNNSGYLRDFWEYDPSTNTWTQKADFGGAGRRDAVGFSIGTKGYIGIGYYGGVVVRDFWEYDSDANTWTRKADFYGAARSRAVGFSIGNKGYIGTGWGGSSNFFKDFWEYDPSTDIWIQKADFGGAARVGAVGFSIGTKGYIGTGSNSSGYLKDFWEYDPSTNTWIQKADFGGTGRINAVGFSIGTKGYVGTGYDGAAYFGDFWEFDISGGAYLVGATNITRNSARLNGTLDGLGKDNNGNNYIFNCYFRYREINTQTWFIALPKVNKSSTGSYYIDITNLKSSTTYEFQAIAECAAGVYYADNILTFTTLKGSAIIQTDNATAISSTSATLNGEVISLGDYSELACYFNWRQKNTETWNTTSPSEILSGIGVFDYALNGLDEGKTYEFRAVGNSGDDYFYGDVKEFTTSGTTLPVVETEPATNIRKDSATLNGELIFLGDYSSADCFFQYRVQGQNNWIETSPKETKTFPGKFSKSITGLTRRYVYEYRAVAETTGGRVYGTIESFEAESWIFDHWEGDATGSENPKTITMDKSKNITAVFIREP